MILSTGISSLKCIEAESLHEDLQYGSGKYFSHMSWKLNQAHKDTSGQSQSNSSGRETRLHRCARSRTNLHNLVPKWKIQFLTTKIVSDPIKNPESSCSQQIFTKKIVNKMLSKSIQNSSESTLESIKSLCKNRRSFQDDIAVNIEEVL